MTHYTSRTWQDQWACRDIQSCITLFDMGKGFILDLPILFLPTIRLTRPSFSMRKFSKQRNPWISSEGRASEVMIFLLSSVKWVSGSLQSLL